MFSLTFEDPAQLYVALSRFRSLNSVAISRWPRRSPKAEEATERARRFHEGIQDG